MKYACSLLIILFFVISVNGQNKKGSSLKGNTEDKIADMIARLPEIIKADAYCKRASHGERHLVTYVAEDPDGENGKY
jgi:hypothetical protein